MPLPRFEKLDPARQRVILDAAAAELAAHGLAGASYNAIIKRAGLSKGAMYYYFADKADLCRTVLEEVLVRLGAAAGGIGPYIDATGYWRELEALVERALVFLFETPGVAELGRMIYGDGAGSEALAPLVARAEAWCAARLAEGQRVGAVRDDLPLELLATAITGLLVHTDRWLATHLDTLPPARLQALSHACFELVRRIAAPPGVPPPPTQTPSKTRPKLASKPRRSPAS